MQAGIGRVGALRGSTLSSVRPFPDHSGVTRLLLIDDDALALTALEVHATRWGYDVEAYEEPRAALDEARFDRVDVVLTDLWLPGISGVDVVRRIRDAAPRVPIVVMSAAPDTAAVVEVMRAGAHDFVQKTDARGLRVDALRGCLERALHDRGITRREDEVEPLVPGDTLTGESRAMRDLRTSLARIGPEEVNVLLLGESGTGKELCARAIHASSPRRDGRLQTVNCAAFQETLLASELFGHEQGAFTGATSLRRGHFEVAAGGTVFLDEIGEAPPGVQASLLRVLQEGEIVRVGGTDPIPIDVRIVAATNRDLQQEVAVGAFRRDLYYRLATFPIRVPPLRERLEDVQPLVQRFLAEMGRRQDAFTLAALDALTRHDWPGNVRELQNVVQQAAILAGEGEIGREHVAIALGTTRPGGAPAAKSRTTADDARFELPLREARAAFERAYLEHGLRRVAGNVARLSRECGIGRVTLYEKLGRLGLDPDDFRP